MPDFRELTRLIVNGDPVDDGTINRVLRDLDGNTRYLRDLFEAAGLGETVYARDRTLAEDTVVGMPVYYNLSSQSFEPGLAAAEVSASGEVLTSLSSQIWGIVATKANSTRGDILLHGVANIDLSAVVEDDTVEAGVYYLSGSLPGQLSLQRPPVGVAVLQSDGAGTVYVKTQFSDLALQHKHYRFELSCMPAGDHTPPSLLDDRHEITNPDPTLDGWLPAGHAVFAGRAPAGAVFGYNLSQAAFQNLWPPLPLESAYLEWDRGEAEHLMAMGVPLGSEGLCIIDRYGIWWMSDCYGDVPWPTLYDSSAGSSSSSSSSYGSPECPRVLMMRMTLYFSKPQFFTSATVVTSLRVAAGSEDVLTVRCVDGAAGSTGALEIASNLGISQAGETASGHVVVKLLDGKVLRRGPVVEGLVSGSNNVVLSGTASSGGLQQGTVTITVTNNLTGRELPTGIIRLAGATEESYEDTLAIGLPPGRDTYFRGQANVPYDLGGITSLQVVLRLRLLARTAGSLPPLTLSYRRLPYSATPVALPTTDTVLTLDLSAAASMAADQYLDVDSSVMTLQPGDEVLFTVARDGAGGDGFAGEVHVLERRLVVTEVASE